MYIFLSFLTAR